MPSVPSVGGVPSEPLAVPIEPVALQSTPTDHVIPLATPTPGHVVTPAEGNVVPSEYLDLTDIGSLMGMGDDSKLLEGISEDMAQSIQTLVQLDQQTWN